MNQDVKNTFNQGMDPPKILFVIAVMLCMVPNLLLLHPDGEEPSSSTEAAVKSFIDDEGNFTTRLRLKNESVRLSILSQLNCGVPGYLEFCFSGSFFSAGRLNFKGALREFYSSVAQDAGAGVFSEQSGFAATDSLSRSSRLGVILHTGMGGGSFSGPDFWAFRANSGELSAGVLFDRVPLMNTELFLIETDLIVSGGTFNGAAAGSSWFFNRPLLPFQTAVNCSSELRVVLNPDYTGRKAFAFTDDDVSAALSFIYDCCFPLYTAPGNSYRGLLRLGNKTFFAEAVVESSSDNYISPSGKPPNEAFSWGGGFKYLKKDDYDLEISGAYNNNQNRPTVLLSRVIEQKEAAEITAVVESRFFRFRFDGDYSWAWDVNGVFSNAAGAQFFFTAESQELRLGAEIGLSIDDVFMTRNQPELKMRVNACCTTAPFAVKFSSEWQGEAGIPGGLPKTVNLSLDVKASTEEYSIFGKITLGILYSLSDAGFYQPDTPTAGFTFGFESFES